MYMSYLQSVARKTKSGRCCGVTSRQLGARSTLTLSQPTPSVSAAHSQEAGSNLAAASRTLGLITDARAGEARSILEAHDLAGRSG